MRLHEPEIAISGLVMQAAGSSNRDPATAHASDVTAFAGVRVSTSDGISLDVEVLGAGPPVLWLPGGPGLANYLRPVAQEIPGFRHVLPDPRGTGRSEGKPHSLDEAVHDLEDLRRAFGS